MDAAIAANAVLGVVEPMSCGIGGDLFAIVWDSKTKRLYGLNASGRSPASASIDFSRPRLKEIPTFGPLSWSVPGCVDGWEQLRKRFGSKAWPELLAPAIDYAETSFPVSEIIAAGWRASSGHQGKSPPRPVLPTRRPCGGKGDVFHQRASLGRSERRQGRPRRVYRGPLAEAIVKYSQSVGVCFPLGFRRAHQQLPRSVSTNYRGFDVWGLPPNGQGIAVLQMLNLLEPMT